MKTRFMIYEYSRARNNYVILRFKNILRTILMVLILNFAFLTFNLSEANAQTVDPSLWQTGATGLQTSSNSDQKTAGLTTIVNASGIPFLSFQGGVKDGRGASGNISGPTTIDLGEIRPVGTTPALISESADWSHNEMTFSNSLKLWISRLSPAALIQNQSNALRLFSGNLNGATIQPGQWAPYNPTVFNRTPAPAYHKYIAYSSGGSTQVQAIPASGTTTLSLPALDNNWIMVWYGGNSHFTETKTPISYSPDYGYGVSILPFSQAYQADAPILIKFENNPSSIIQSPEGGIDLTFSGNSGYTSILPLFGREHPKAYDPINPSNLAGTTEEWGVNGILPANVLTKINFWTNRLCSYPTQVSETYSYDSNTDTSTISENITFLPVCTGASAGTIFSILPPMMALTLTTPDQQGNTNPLGITVSGTTTNANYPTEFGPILGIDDTNTYSWSVSGLKKYTDNKRVITNTGTAPPELVQELQTEVDKIINAGHFKPWLMSDEMPRNPVRGDIYFLNPADIILLLTEIIPVLPEPQKTNLVNYLKSERTNYPPETVYNLPDTGTLRVPFSVNDYPNWLRWRPDIFLNRVPLYSFYALAKYYELTGESIASNSAVIASAKTALDNDMKEQDWATFSWFKGFEIKRTAIINTNRYLDGMIGFVKLSQIAGDTQAENLGRSFLAKAVLVRIAEAKYPRYLYAAGTIVLPNDPAWLVKYTRDARSGRGYIFNYNWSGPYDDTQQIGLVNQFEVYLSDHSGFSTPGGTWGSSDNGWREVTSPYLSAYRDMVPETFRFLNDYAKQDFEINQSKYTTLLPDWYSAFSEGILGEEHNINHPIDSYQIFMAKAFTQNESPQNLEKFADRSWLEAGDFFYVHKLAETVKAYQGIAWEDEINPPSPTPTPAPCTLTSASWSTNTVTGGVSVNLNVTASGDCANDSVNFNVRRNISGLPDEDAYNQPNPNPVTLEDTDNDGTYNANTTWTSDNWFNACALLLTCDPEYFFNATVDSNTQRSADPLLTVTKSTTIPTDPNDWPQVQKDPQHTGYSSETLGTNFRVAWTYPFQPDRVHPQVQAIIYQGKAFVGTEGANGQKPTLYALDAVNPEPNTNPPRGRVVWRFDVGGPILNSAAADNGKVYVSSLDGAIYAIYTDSENGHNQGQLAWKQQLSTDRGFSTAPVIADGKVMIGGRDGYFYALNPSDGAVLWRYNAGAPILQTAAYNNGKAYFGSMDMYVHGVNTTDGSLAWKSQKIPGIAFKDYWPVVTQNKVFITPISDRSRNGINPGFPFYWFSTDSHWAWLLQWGSAIATGSASLVPDVMNAQDSVMASYQTNPANYINTLFILDENTGEEALVVPNTTNQTMNGATTPPCVDREGMLVVPIMFINSRWGRLDLISGRIVDILYDGYARYGQPVSNTNRDAAGGGNSDENLNVTCTGNIVLSMHTQEYNANYTGYFNQDTRRWTPIGTGHRNRQMSTNTQGGGGNPASVSNGMIYHVSFHELIARTTN